MNQKREVIDRLFDEYTLGALWGAVVTCTIHKQGHTPWTFDWQIIDEPYSNEETKTRVIEFMQSLSTDKLLVSGKSRTFLMIALRNVASIGVILMEDDSRKTPRRDAT